MYVKIRQDIYEGGANAELAAAVAKATGKPAVVKFAKGEVVSMSEATAAKLGGLVEVVTPSEEERQAIGAAAREKRRGSAPKLGSS